jgi:ABC-type branched-subunit amino acid transport system ATPase component
MSTLLVDRLRVFYGQAQALHEASFSVGSPGITCLMGRNGVGKTTTLRAIMGLQPIQAGQLHLDGTDITRLYPHQRASLGIHLVPQERLVFPGLTVGDHLRFARSGRSRGRRSDHALEQWLDLFPVLAERRKQLAETLSGGERKMLAIAQALAGGADFLLMDEPTEGVQPNVVEQIARALGEIGKLCGLLLVEQNLDVILYLGGTGYVMEKGAIAVSGTVEELERNGSINRYLSV